MLRLLPLFLLIGSSLAAQSDKFDRYAVLPLQNTFALSLTVTPDRVDGTFNQLWVRAADTIDRGATFPDSDLRLFDRRTIEVDRPDGTREILYVEDGYGEDGRLEQADPEVQLRFSLRGHYRFGNNFGLNAGINYLGYSERRAVLPTDDLPREFFYTTNTNRVRTAGLVIGAEYYLLPYSRFQPFAGVRSFVNLREQTVTNRALVSADGSFSQPQSVDNIDNQNVTFDLDLDLVLGVAFRVSNRFSVGIEGGSGTSFRRFIGDLQVRYHLIPRR